MDLEITESDNNDESLSDLSDSAEEQSEHELEGHDDIVAESGYGRRAFVIPRKREEEYKTDESDDSESEYSSASSDDDSDDELQCKFDPQMDSNVKKVLTSAVKYRLPQQEAAKPLIYGKNVNTILLELYALRQNCKTNLEFNELEDRTQNLINLAARKDKPTIKVRFALEQAKNAHIRKDMERAIDIAQEASRQCDYLPPDAGHQLKLVCLFLMTSCYSNIAKLGSAYEILYQLEQKITAVDNPIDKWKLYYNYGTHYIAYLKQFGEPQPAVRDKGEQYFINARQAITTAVNKGSTFALQEQIFPLIMVAKILLDVPESRQGQGRDVVTLYNIQEAEETISSIKSIIAAQQMDVRLRARLAITEGGLYFRKAQSIMRKLKKPRKKKHKRTSKEEQFLLQIHEHLNQAVIHLDYAKSICLNTPYQEIQFASDFITFLQTFINENINIEFEKGRDIKPLTSDTSFEADQPPQAKKETSQTAEIKTEGDLPDVDFIMHHRHKVYIPDILTQFCFQDRYRKELEALQQHFHQLLTEPKYRDSADTDMQVMLMVFPYLLLIRVAMDFPETEWSMDRFTITIENLDRARNWLSEVKRRVFLHNMPHLIKVYYLLAEASYHYRNGQMAEHMTREEKDEEMRKVKGIRRKQCYCDAIFYLQHTLLCLEGDTDNFGIGDSVKKLL